MFQTLEVERASLTEKVRLIEADGNTVTLHPAAIDKFGAAMEEMHAALSNVDFDVERLRVLVEPVVPAVRLLLRVVEKL